MSDDALVQWAAEERKAARVGGMTWRLFVREAERQTGIPWATLRDLINPYQRAYYDSLETESRAQREVVSPTKGTE